MILIFAQLNESIDFELSNVIVWLWTQINNIDCF
jgi:hypothetical protein